MSDWLPLVLICSAIALVIRAAFFWSINMRGRNDQPHKDFSDTLPLDRKEPAPAALMHAETVVPEETVKIEPAIPAPINPALQVAQDNLNYTLWHQLLWRIPNTKWVETQYQSLAEVQWLCLGPDHCYFIAHADLDSDEWKWTFAKA